MNIEKSEPYTVRIRIAGRVQGVGYRVWAQRNAQALGLDGWIRNRRDGSVEAVFSGAPEKVLDMLARCNRGPYAARVEDVAILEEPAGAPEPSFRVLPAA